MGQVVRISEQIETDSTRGPSSAAKQRGQDVAAVFAWWQQITGHTRARLDAKTAACVAARLAVDGFTADDLMDAVEGMMVTPHNQGQNDRCTVYDSLELVCRSGAQVNRFLATIEARRALLAQQVPSAAATPVLRDVTRGRDEIAKIRQMLQRSNKWGR